MITTQQLIDAGYRKYTGQTEKQFSNVMYQKRVDDELGKKYFINVSEWDNHEYRLRYSDMLDFSYEAGAQLTDDLGTVFNVELLCPDNIKSVEAFFEGLWVSKRCEYYEKF
jgi:hypothetical protein